MSSSDSNTTEETIYNDSRKVFGAGSNDASNGGRITNVTNITDGGAIAMAGKALDSSLGFGADVVGGAFSFGSKALTSSLNFAGDTVSDALAANQRAITASLNAANESANNAFAFASQSASQSALAQREALDTATGSLSQALAYGGKQTAVALDSLAGSANLVKDAYADAKGRGALTDKILMVAIAGAMFVAYNAMRK